MTMIKKIKMLLMLVLVITMLPIYAINASANGEIYMSVGTVSTEPGSSVCVPITISNNTGICGSTISIKYDSRLTLTRIDKGEAWETLTMTKPGNLSANPVKITWDGLEEDYTNGTIAMLTFSAPAEPGKYDIQVSYDDGDIVNGNLETVYPIIEQGYIEIPAAEKEKIIAENLGVFHADEGYEGSIKAATAFKAELGSVTGAISFTVIPTIGEMRTFENVTQITDANVVFGIVVSGLDDANAVGEIIIK